jgi:hypothetical protein
MFGRFRRPAPSMTNRVRLTRGAIRDGSRRRPRATVLAATEATKVSTTSLIVLVIMGTGPAPNSRTPKGSLSW